MMDRSFYLFLGLLLPLVLMLSENAWALEPWRVDEGSQILEHLPARLSFPLKVGSLTRESHDFGQNPYTPQAASVSYGVPGVAVVVVTIVPDRDPNSTAEKLFAARTLLFRQQQTGAVPTTLSPITSSCKRATPATRLTSFDLQATRESFYTTALAGHVLYVRATEARRDEQQAGGGALGAFLAAMDWPCPEALNAR